MVNFLKMLTYIYILQGNASVLVFHNKYPANIKFDIWLVIGVFICIRLDISPNLWYLSGYFVKYLVSSCIFGGISGY